MPTRRTFLATLAAAATAPALTWADAGSPHYLAAAREASGAYALFGLTDRGEDLFRIPLPDRGHAAAAHPKAPEAVAFARRPGRFALVIDCVSGRVLHELEAPEGRHFYGHGAFIADGDVMVTPENAFETGEGKLGLWSRREGYARIGEIATHGTGPHDILRMKDDVMVVANGGILTHPDRGREKLNIDSMEPSLVYLTPEGELLEQVVLEPDLHKNSIRHLAQTEDGLVAFAMQWQGDLSDPVPLLGLHRRGQAPVLCQADLGEQLAMKGYAGSVALDATGRLAGITSPRGGRVHLFDLDGGFVESLRRQDVCGLATAPGGMVASDGLGAILGIGAGGVEPRHVAEGRSWDNHMVAVRG
ncbi:DUF1513 domain-containing protein [Aquicoccus sp. SCR17]|nr:DUF1513 domain-containing protein [Carideicomes alvinocaridis]